MTSENILEIMTAQLTSAAFYGTRPGQLAALTPILHAVTEYAVLVSLRKANWAPVREGAAERAQLAIAAFSGFEAWSAAIAAEFYGGGEEHTERALTKHSQLRLLCELFRGTEAEVYLASLNSAETDRDYQMAAASLYLQAPEWVPQSHSWWYWPAE